MTNPEHFVTCAEDVISVDVSIKTGVTAIPKNVTKNKHFVTRWEPVILIHTSITTTICDSFIRLKDKK